MHAAEAEHTRALQARMREKVRVVVRVTVGKDEARFVSLFASPRKRAWGLVVEAIASASG